MIKKFSLLSFITLTTFFGFSQENKNWRGYFSYNQVKEISETPTGVVVASENALFYKNTSSENLSTFSTVDGLSGQEITSVYYSSATEKTIVGFKNGLLQIIDKNGVFNVVEILNKTSITSSSKSINHFNENQDRLYISCDFGISVFDLKQMKFLDSYFIGDAGTETSVIQTVILNDYLYAVTKTNGIKKVNLNNPAIVDYTQWELYQSGLWLGIQVFNNQIVLVNSDNKLILDNGTSQSIVAEESSPILKIKSTTNHLLVVTFNGISIYNKDFTKQSKSSTGDVYTCAHLTETDLYVGTQTNGIIQTSLNDLSSQTKILPDGPVKNTIFSLYSTSSKLWALYGDHTADYNPYPLDELGISSLVYRNGWDYIPYENLFGAKSLARMVAHPSDENKLYVASYFSGLLEINNGVATQLYDHTNSELESLFLKEDPSYVDVRINAPVFDAQGNLWVNNSYLEEGLKMMTPKGEWKSYSLKLSLDTSLPNSYGRMTIDKNGTKWLVTNKSGVVGFNEKLSESIRTKGITQGSKGNLPIFDARAVAVDQNNQLWIGTTKGLRVLPNVDSFMTQSSLNTNNIVILDDGLAQELLYEQFITDIYVDGANRKWIATADSGLFCVSFNGQKTLYHFTNSNSPLPSNSINDIEMNKDTGELFIATDKGMVSFMTNTTASKSNLDNVLVYPNPVRPNYQGMIHVSGLIDQCNVKITDITGNLVHQATAEGGTIQWDGTAFGQYKVASGVYLVFIVTEDGNSTQAKKIMIVR